MSATFDSQYRRYDRIYQAFLAAGVPLAGLIGGSKKPFNDSAPKSLLRDLYQVEAAMDAGLNVGAVTHQAELPGINPMGFWDLDIDGPDHGLNLSPFAWRVRRDGEIVRAHYLARLQDPSAPIDAGYKGRDYDICTWNTVMPGSVHKSGTVYNLEHLEDGEWRQYDGENFSIEMLPMIDPELYRSEVNHRQRKPRSNVNPLKTKPRTARKPPVWVTATGSLASRTKMARDYLKYYAWKSISGMNGHDSLLVVVVNLRLFHRLEQSLALEMIKEHFNPRCVDLKGNPAPWKDSEILHKWKEAGKPGAYPTLGVKHPRARAKEARLMLEGEVEEFLGHFTQDGGTTNPTTLRLSFIASRGGEDVNATAFGRAVSKAAGVQTTTPNGKRVYQGFSLTEAGLGFTRRGGEAA